MAKRKRRGTLELGPNKESINLYKFIKMVVGEDTPDRAVAIAWKMDVKNFHQIKTGQCQVPKLPRLLKLGEILDVNPYIVMAVGTGVPAKKAYRAVVTGNRKAQQSILIKSNGPGRPRQPGSQFA